MSLLFSPITIKNVEFRNRVMIPPMCQYSAKDGIASDWHFAHYGSMAAGGAGSIILEATGVVPAGRITPYCLGIWNDEQAEKLSHIFRFIESQGAVPGIQLAHAGRKASTERTWKGGRSCADGDGGWTPVYAPSEIAYADGYRTPHALTKGEIAELVDAFKSGAERALKAGAKIIEIHSAHGYLLHEFLSPITNIRTDEYGGSLENRYRFLKEIVSAIAPLTDENHLLFVRMSATDWVEGGYTPEEAVETAKMLKSLGVDMIDTSTGGLTSGAKIPAAPMFQVPFAEKIKNEAEMTVSCVGIITDPYDAEKILKDGRADFVQIGRGFLRNHQWAIDAAKTLGDTPPIPIQYHRAY